MQEEHKRLTHEEVQRRVREGIRLVLEQIMEEETAEQLAATFSERYRAAYPKAVAVLARCRS